MNEPCLCLNCDYPEFGCIRQTSFKWKSISFKEEIDFKNTQIRTVTSEGKQISSYENVSMGSKVRNVDPFLSTNLNHLKTSPIQDRTLMHRKDTISTKGFGAHSILVSFYFVSGFHKAKSLYSASMVTGCQLIYL